jgi:hypothetical protein
MDQPTLNQVVAASITTRAAKLGIYSKGLADVAGSSLAELEDALAQRRSFDVEELVRIAELLGCGVADLVAEPANKQEGPASVSQADGINPPDPDVDCYESASIEAINNYRWSEISDVERATAIAHNDGELMYVGARRYIEISWENPRVGPMRLCPQEARRIAACLTAAADDLEAGKGCI